VGFLAKEHLPEVESIDGYVPAAPDLAVEVLLPTDSQRLLMCIGRAGRHNLIMLRIPLMAATC